MIRTDVLMITYNRPDYVRISLPQLLDTCGDTDRVWLWHNGDDEETLEVVRPYARDDRVARFHHSRENLRLFAPTRWLHSESTADYLSKVDDDCVLPSGWITQLAAAHAAIPELGVLGSWRFRPEDYRPDLSTRKLATYPGDYQVLRNHWVQGSGYLMKRKCIERCGPMKAGETFTGYCLQLARAGWVNGWYYPFIQEEHMDDPRSPYTRLHTDADLRARMPLTAQRLGIHTLAQWETAVRQSAFAVQAASLDLRQHSPLRWRARGVRSRVFFRMRARWPATSSEQLKRFDSS